MFLGDMKASAAASRAGSSCIILSWTRAAKVEVSRWEVNDLVGRRAGLCAGSVALHRRVSPRLTNLILVRLMPHSVELHWVAVEVLGLVKFSHTLSPKNLNCSTCSLFQHVWVDLRARVQHDPTSRLW